MNLREIDRPKQYFGRVGKCDHCREEDVYTNAVELTATYTGETCIEYLCVDCYSMFLKAYKVRTD